MRAKAGKVKRGGFIALLLLAATAAAAAASAREVASPTATRCGGQLWRLKTLSDPGRRSVALAPKTTTIGAIVVKPFPRPVPTRRRTPFQRQNWEVVAQITAYKLEDPGIRLELYDNGTYVNAVIPRPSCLPKTARGRAAMIAAWNAFTTNCARATPNWQPLGAIMYVSGVGFWGERRPERGRAPNGAELHPVTGFRVVVGCRR
jgi:hypothetical protein